jgi:hypothetical protein
MKCCGKGTPPGTEKLHAAEQMKKNRELILLSIILITGAWLRFHKLGEISFSNDELSALTRARFDSFHDLVEKGIKVDGHPALVQTMIWFTIHYFNDDVFTVRFPFALSGVISIVLIFLLAKRWFGSATGILSATALSTLQFFVLYSQTARPYAIGLMFSLAFALCWTKFLFDERKNKWIFIAYIFSGIGCIYSHYFSFMLAGIIGASGLFFVRKNNLRTYLICNAIIVVSFMPSIPIFNQQFGYGGIGGWLPPPDRHFFSRFMDYALNGSAFLQLIVFLIFLISAGRSAKAGQWKKFHLVSLAWFFLPLIAGFCYSIWKAPVLQFSTLIFSFPFILIFAFSFVNEQWINKKIILFFSIALLVSGAYSTVFEKNYYTTNHFGVFKELAEKSKEWDMKYGSENVLKQFSLSNPEYINYYFRKLHHDPHITIYSDDEQSRYGLMTAMLDTTQSRYYAYAWTNAGHAYETTELIMEKFPVVVENDTFFNSQIILFGRGKSPLNELLISATDFETDRWDKETAKQNTEVSHSGIYSQRLDGNTEYSIAFRSMSGDLHLGENEMLKAETWFYASDSIKDASLVIAFVKNDQMLSYADMPLKNFYLRSRQWTRAFVFASMPDENCEVRIYIWNKQRETFYIDDMKVYSKKRNPVYRPI